MIWFLVSNSISSLITYPLVRLKAALFLSLFLSFSPQHLCICSALKMKCYPPVLASGLNSATSSPRRPFWISHYSLVGYFQVPE